MGFPPCHTLAKWDVVVVVVGVTMGETMETIGFHSDTSGRSCCMHAFCGDHVEVGDVMRLVSAVIECQGAEEASIKCVKVVD